MDSETANLLGSSSSSSDGSSNDSLVYPPSSSSSSPSYFWPAGIASLTIQTPETASRRTKARLSTSTSAALPCASQSSHPAAAAAARSRWTSTEFCIYYLVIAFYLWKMVQAPIRLSQGK